MMHRHLVCVFTALVMVNSRRRASPAQTPPVCDHCCSIGHIPTVCPRTRYSPNVAALSCNSCIRKVTSCFSDEEAVNQIRVIIDPCSVHATPVVRPSRPVTLASEMQNGPAGNHPPPPLPHVAPAQCDLLVVLPPPPEVPGLATFQANFPLKHSGHFPLPPEYDVGCVHSPFKAS